MTEKTIDLAELLFELSPLNRRHAELLSERWAKDVIQELQDTGVSVISGPWHSFCRIRWNHVPIGQRLANCTGVARCRRLQ